MSLVSDAPVEFDPFSQDYFNGPYDIYRRMRDHAPVWYSERYGFWALFRYADVVAAHRDWETFSSSRGPDLFTMSLDAKLIYQMRQIIMMDPPEHETMRGLVSKVFTPRAIAELEPMVREVITSFIEPYDDADAFDAVADFSGPFPVEVISRMLGVPEGERQQIRHWLDVGLSREPGKFEPSQAGIEANIATSAYFHELIQEKRKRPADDMLSRLLEVEVEREDGEKTRLDDTEIAGFAGLLGGAGAETVTKLVGNAVVLFHRNPGEWEKVKADPTTILGAVEEILRYWPPSQYQGRYTMHDAVIDGVTIPAGNPVFLVTGSATRDERFYDDPDRFDIGRPKSLSLGFGYGVHSCLGAALARMESRIAIEELIRRWPSYAVDEDNCKRVQMTNVAGYSSVPVRRV